MVLYEDMGLSRVREFVAALRGCSALLEAVAAFQPCAAELRSSRLKHILPMEGDLPRAFAAPNPAQHAAPAPCTSSQEYDPAERSMTQPRGE